MLDATVEIFVSTYNFGASKEEVEEGFVSVFRHAYPVNPAPGQQAFAKRLIAKCKVNEAQIEGREFVAVKFVITADHSLVEDWFIEGFTVVKTGGLVRKEEPKCAIF